MKIIINNASIVKTCDYCKSKLEISPTDIKQKTCLTIVYHYYICPCCKQYNYIK